MARTPTVYRWDDPGAPDLSALHPSNNERDLMYFHTVLKACLVTGYGAKAAAGWIMPHEETTPDGKGNRFVLTNAANSGSLLYEGGTFSGGGGYNIDTLWACGAVPDMDTPVNAWSWNVKYDDRNTASGNVFHKTGARYKYGCDAWVVIANENTCIVIFGKQATDFNVLNAGGLNLSSSGVFMFGAMHDGLGGVVAPNSGNFYIAIGDKSSYAGLGFGRGLQDALLTSLQDVLGLYKSDSHTYQFNKSTVHSTAVAMDAWLPEPVIYTQFGPSSPSGDSLNNVHFAVALPSMMQLKIAPQAYAELNDFMSDNSFEYGQSVSYNGYDCIVCKSYSSVVNVFSLHPREWGV